MQEYILRPMKISHSPFTKSTCMHFPSNCVPEKSQYLYLSQIIGQDLEFVLILRDPESHRFPKHTVRADTYLWGSSDKWSLSPSPSRGGHKVSVNPSSGYLPQFLNYSLNGKIQ